MDPRSLTPDQVAAVNYDGSRCLVIAPAGSGKTEVLIRRVVRHVSSSRGESFRVLAVTYTRKAAEELRRRVRRAVGDEAWRVDADTIHGFALDWLTRFGRAVRVPRDVVVYSDPSDRIAIIQRFLETLGESAVNNEILLALLSDFDRHSNDFSGSQAVDAFLLSVGLTRTELREAYEQGLEDVGGIDFHQMLTKFCSLLDIDESILRRFHRTYKYVLVDEGQDLTQKQSELLQRLVSSEVSLFVVADDRQSINRWAGGGIEWARALVGHDAEEFQLVNNFRCSVKILSVASQLARHFGRPRADGSTPPGAPFGIVEQMASDSPEDEAIVVADWLTQLLSAGLPDSALVEGESPTILPEEMGVIARNRYSLEPVWAELDRRANRISMLTDAKSLLKTSEGRLFHALLGIAANDRDHPSIRQANEELAFLLPEEAIHFEPGQAETEPLGFFHERLDQTPLKALCEIAQNALSGDMEQHLARLPAVPITGPGWEEDVHQLTEWWESYRASTRLQERDLAGFLRYLFQMEQTRADDPGIRLLTTHRAKGLEFRAVAIVGLAQGGFPDYRSLDDEETLDQERRAFYVALTRASRALLVTWPRRRTSRYGRTFHNQPSQFLAEAGLD